MNTESADHPFRPQALDARKADWLGEIVMLRPPSFAFLCALAGACALSLLAYLAWGSYTTRSTVSGQLIPDSGLLKVYANAPGVVLQKLVQEGQNVQQGQVLYVLSGERQIGSGAIQAAISGKVEERRQSLAGERDQARQLQRRERTALEGKVASLEAEAAKLDAQIDGQKSRIKLAADAAARYQGLQTQNFISRDALGQKQEDLLDQRIRLQALERDRIGVGRELSTQKNELDSLATHQHSQIAQLERGMASASQEFTESEAKRRMLVIAPHAGVATAVRADQGQTVDPSRPLLNLVPAGATLEAHLLAPSRAIGFIKPGDAVLLRYQAFPYQKFGHARGVVASVARTALPTSELDVGGAAPGAEPMYAITVKLARQSIDAYGKPQPLQAGMLLDADILQESRHLYEWVLAPLRGISGKY
ncbi:MAG: HlyD family efflux transporter periplasmic adaptor subunit [Pseudomonadota bacterium]